MEIIKINHKAVKVILSRDECEKYEFIRDEYPSDAEMTSSLDRLLKEIYRKEGIDLIKQKLLVQIYPCKDMGCEVYICDTEVDTVYKERGGTGLKKSPPYISVYRFDTLDMLVTACQRLNELTEDTGSEVYYDENAERYYLISRAIAPKEIRFAFLNEYAKSVKAPYAHYVREHLKCICSENAVNIFSQLA